jgi:hypothetical protein
VVAVAAWTLAQLVPSPLLVAGTDHVGGGRRWQITPLLYSFGIAAEPFESSSPGRSTGKRFRGEEAVRFVARTDGSMARFGG